MEAKKDSEEEETFEVAPSAPEKPPTPTTAEFAFRPIFYSVVKIDIGTGFKEMREEFQSSWKDEESALTVLKVNTPIGMVIDEVQNKEGRKEGIFEIVEVIEGSNAEAAGIKVGDAIRACNAVVRKPV